MAPPLRVPLAPLEAGELVLDEALSRYVGRVHRARVGEAMLLFDPEARLQAEATVLEVARRVRLAVSAPSAAPRAEGAPVTLLQGLGKGDKLDQVVRDATALGAARIFAVATERTVVSLGERARPRRERWLKVAIQAARQCGRGDLPEVMGPLSLEEALSLATSEVAWRLALDPGGAPLAEGLRAWSPPAAVAVLVGPEGGLSPAERERATAAGFVLVRLGRHVLRTETAATAALGALAALGDRPSPLG